MIRAFLRWWAAQLLDLLPARAAAGPADALLIAPLDDAAGPRRVALARRRGGRVADLGRVALDGTANVAIRAALRPPPARIVLRLPAALLLDREVVLPLAAEAEPTRVLAYEMDRITPFAAAEVFWTHVVERRDRAHGRLHLRLSLVPRAAVADLLAALRDAGLVPTALEAAAEDGTVRRIELRVPAQPRRTRRVARRALAATCAALGLAAVALPFLQQSRAMAEVEGRIAALRPAVDAAEALRRRIAADAAGTDVIAAERARLGDALAVLATLTDLLPDDTSLTDLTLRQGKLTLNGRSAAAPRLIAALSADPAIRNADFAAPVTRMDGGRADQFAIRADLGP